MARPPKSPLAGLSGTGGMGSKGVPAFGVRMPSPSAKVRKGKAPAALAKPGSGGRMARLSKMKI